MAVPFARHISGSTSVATGLVVERDAVAVSSGDGRYRDTLSREFTVSPTEAGLLRSTAGSTVTLITCTKDLNQLGVTGTIADVVSGSEDA